MTEPPAEPPAPKAGPSLRWLAGGAVAAGTAAASAILHAAPATSLLDYPRVDALLRQPAWIAGALGAAGIVGLVAGTTAALRKGRAIEFASGAAAAGWLALAFGGWVRLEAHESELERHELSAMQELALRSVRASMDAAVSGLDALGTARSEAERDSWRAAAGRLVSHTPGARAAALVAPNVPPLAVGPDADRVHAILAEAAAAARTDRPWAAAAGLAPGGLPSPDARIVVVVPADGDRQAALLIDLASIAPVADALSELEIVTSVAVGAPGEASAPEPPAPEQSGAAPGGLQPAHSVRTEGLAWSLRAFPTKARMDTRHQRGNTTLLAFGWLGAIGCAAAGVALRRTADARRHSEDSARRLAVASARARIAALGREALAAEAGHVLRARIRETLRTLESAEDPIARTEVRADALARACESLSLAESEVDALLDRPGRTRIERAETDAALDHLYSQTVLDLPGCPSLDVAQPVPSGAVADVQRRLSSRTFAVISSDNPMSVVLGARANQLRRGVLATALRSAGHAHVPATGRSRDGSWSEQGFAVALRVEEADAIAELHEQRAYFWFDGERLWIHEVVGARRTLELPRPTA